VSLKTSSAKLDLRSGLRGLGGMIRVLEGWRYIFLIFLPQKNEPYMYPSFHKVKLELKYWYCHCV